MRTNLRAAQVTRGVALVIVLSFVVLLSTIVLAVFSRTATLRQVSQSSCKQATADELARSALAIVVSSLRQEIVDGSTDETQGAYTLYIPISGAQMVPQRNGTWSDIPNLVRVSSRTRVAPPGVDLALASNAATTATSANGRCISTVRWNRHFLLARKYASQRFSTDPTPVDSFTVPEWVYVTDQGPTVLTSPTSSATGRYAFAVYNEGGLLDMNVAGYPPLATGTLTAQKGVLAFADLTCLDLSGSMVNNIVGWRNYATAQASGPDIRNLFPDAASAYCQAALDARGNGFLRVGGSDYHGRTDQAWLSRQQLLNYRNQLKFLTNALPHMGTFSRAVTAPTRFHGIRVANPGTCLHYHDDGSSDEVAVSEGEPLLRSRFSLAKLKWIAQPGVVVVGTSAIQACFGIPGTPAASGAYTLSYVGPSGSDLQPIKTLNEVASETNPREPNFFELLKEAISAGGERLSDPEIIATGATIISNYACYQSVGGLGYKDILGFWSADRDCSALLDVFSAVEEPPVSAGKFNPNQSHDMVLYSILSGAAKVKEGSSRISDGTALTSAVMLQSKLRQAPMLDLAGLPDAISAIGGLGDDDKRAVLVALASVSNVRTWNLLIDVIAQSGVFPPNASSLDRFVVQSERRYWLRVAIDRYTGKVVDQQLEPVYE